MQMANLQASGLSKQQERYWRWQKANQIYGAQTMLLLEGEFDLENFQQALQQSVERYEILRTTFSVMPGMELPMQVLGQSIELRCPLLSLQHLDAARQQNILEQQWQDLTRHSFDLDHGPLLYAPVFRLSEKQHILLLRMCVLCADASTLKYFSAEILQRYNLLQQGKIVSKEEDDDVLQYIDVISWQKDTLLAEGAEEQLAFWKNFDFSQLDAVHLPFKLEKKYLSLTQDHEASLIQQVPIVLETAEQQSLQDLCQRYEVSLEVCLLVCWQILLWRLTDSAPLIGVSCDGRPYEELATTLGPYTQAVPFSLSLNEEVRFQEALAETSLMLREMREKQLYFNWEALAPDRSLAQQVFPISFAFDSWPQHWQVGSLVARLLQVHCELEPLHLHLQVSQIGSQCDLRLYYRPTLFSQQEAQRLAHLFPTLLSSILAAPQARVGSLALLSQQEQTLALARWRGPRQPWPFVPLHQQIQAQVARQPSAPVLRCGEVLLSYEQVEQQANQLAHLLLAQGLRPGQRVALYQRRGPWAIICLLAVLKAGGSYVPLDEDLPVAHLHQVLEHLAPTVLICSQDLLERLPEQRRWQTQLVVEELSALLGEQAVSAPAVAVLPGQEASLIYTSGSTGLPKGVQISQQGISNYTQALCELLELSSGWHFATVSSLAADLGNTSIFGALASGGCLHLLPYALVTDGAAFAAYTRRFPLDVLKIVPTHLQALLAAGAEGILPHQCLILGGEALPWSLLEHLQKRQDVLESCQLYNHYGPTETTIGCLVNPLGPIRQIAIPAPEERGQSVPIGRPIANLRVAIWDEQQQPVPAGVKGELYIAGAGVALGYLGQPELTAQRFVSRKDGRWYRSGDIVRENEEGLIEFIGRRDSQVKLRGYRIELGEIEAHLRSLPQTREAVVQLRTDVPGRQQESCLVGYVVPWKQSGAEPQTIREALAQILPSYLVPSRIICLEQLPLSANGKVDRRRLPVPTGEQEERNQGEAQEQARTPIEGLMQQIWRQVLQTEQIGREDDFFQAGGHSLLGTRMIAQLRSAFGVEVPITWLFETPTVAGLAQRIEEAMQQAEAPAIPPIVSVSREQDLPLSFAQQRLWFLDQWEPGSITYNVPVALLLNGHLCAQALQESLYTIINRHEVLRTTFAMRGEQPVQVIHSTALSPMHWVDLTGLPERARDPLARQLAQQDMERPFDLQHGPLLRVSLLRLAEQEHVLVLTMHHAISDAWSHPIWQRELSTLYTSRVNGTLATLPELPVQYADYALWQRQWLREGVLQQQLDYWKQQLAGLVPLELPTDHQRPSVQTFRGAVQRRFLPAELGPQLHALALQEGVTLFMLMLAAFQVLLSRYSGQKDIVVGTPIANRSREEIADLIGFFTNTLVLRSDLSDDPSFVELLKRVRTTALEAYIHQDVPFEQVVEALQPERDQSRSPLFQVLFILQHANSSTNFLPDLTLQRFGQEAVTSKFDLTLSIWESEQQLHTGIEYNSDLFDPTTIERLLDHWQALLQALVQYPDQSVASLSLWPSAALQTILRTWTGPRETTLDERCLHHLFEKQAQQTPDACAVSFGELQVSYWKLNEQAQRLAGYLRAQGVGPDQLVGLCLPRSLDLMVGVLAILKAGGAYVPLDPAYPQQWIEQVVQQAGLHVILTQESLQERLHAVADVLLCLDDDLNVEEGATAATLIPSSPDQLAYVIYTSGSTGVPKGVAMPHRGLVNLIEWQRMRSTVGHHSRTLQFTSISFDVSCQELFATWSTGGCLVLIDQETRQDAQLLLHRLSEQAIERLFLPFIALHHLAQVAQQRNAPRPESLREIITAGEQLQVSRSLIEFFKQLPECRLDNQYGPAETHVATAFQLPEETERWLSLPPIGSALTNDAVYVLNEQLQPVPIGAVGELYLGGVGLARGYWQRSDLTAERFLPHPWSEIAGARLYRTGDQVRSRADGTLEFVGRRDQQVKVRGYRIELEQVEAVVREHPAIRAAAINVQEVGIGDKRLIAYIERQSEQPLTLSELRQYVGERLPEYMLPAGLVELEQLPLTASGKVDRRALTKWKAEVSRTQEEGAAQGPRSEMEQHILEIWRQVLKNPQMGVLDNFFELGGHSLLATQVVTRLQQVFRVHVPVRTIFEYPTVASLAQQFERQHLQGRSAPPLQPVSRDNPLPLSFAQQRLWFLDQLKPGNAAYNIPSALRFRGPLDCNVLEQALYAVIQRHESLRTTFPSQQGEPVQKISSEPLNRLITLDLRHLSQKEREQQMRFLAEQEAECPFDLAQGPLLRCWLLLLAEEDQVMLLTVHHIIFDGWSIGVLTRELTMLYAALRRGESAATALPVLPVQYADYVVWQRSWMQGEVLEQQVDYWKGQLAGVPPLELPTDHPRPPHQTFRGARERVQLPSHLTQELHTLSQRGGVTLFMTLLAAFQVLLARYSGQSDIAVGSPVANRVQEELERLVGLFINTLVLRTDLSGNPSFVELLARVREVALGAYSHRELPFEQVVEALDPPRDQSRSSLFQAFFMLQTIPDEVATVQSSVKVESLASEQSTSKFELSLVVAESQQGLVTTLEYNSDLFTSATITRMLSHWQQLLEGIVANPQQPIFELPLLTDQERQQMFIEWNKTDAEYQQETLHAGFEQQVARTPDAIALVFEQQALTYEALNRFANCLAHHLRRQGVGPDVLVGIRMERSLELVIGLLGILKAGGAYVPLDPTYPPDRLAFVLVDAQISILLTQSNIGETVSHISQQIIFLDQVWDELAGQPASNLPNKTMLENAAYCIYTSGSTGNPKGVVLSHRNVMNIFTGMDQQIGEDQPGIWLAVTSISFDISVLELFWTLSRGFRVIMQENLERANAVSDSLEAWEYEPYEDYSVPAQLVRHGVTHLQCTPSFARMLLLMPGIVAGLQGLHALILAGEALPLSLVQEIQSISQASLYNSYGPTETTIWSTTALIEAGSKDVTIGYPLANTQIYLLDRHLQPVPMGAAGEVYIGGFGVSRGYHHRPDLTAERFIPDQWSLRPGARLYRTGDLARYHSDGSIEYLGRSDQQVKVRGYRIELGEIEATLLRHPAIRQAVVVVHEQATGDKQLVAYLAPAGDVVIPGNVQLRHLLKDTLPDYMIPTAFVVLDALPLTPNGKVDRRALATLTLRPQAEQSRYVPPRDDVEYQLRDIWEELLDVSPIGVLDNFFNLGGHSIQIVKLMASIKHTFNRDLPLAVLFQYQTVAALATLLRDQSQIDEQHSIAIPLQPQGKRIPFFCVHPVGGEVFVYKSLSQYLGEEQPFYGLHMPDPQKHSEQFSTLEGIAACYITAIRELQPQGPYQIGGWSAGGLVAYEIAQQLQEQGHEVRLLALIDSRPPIANRNPVREEEEGMDDIALTKYYTRRYGITLPEELAQQGNPEKLFAYVCEQLKQRQIVPHDALPVHVRPVAQTVKTMETAAGRYVPQPYAGQVVLFRSMESTGYEEELQLDELEASEKAWEDWKALAMQGMKMHLVPGSHVTMIEKPYVKELATALALYLNPEQHQVLSAEAPSHN